MTACTPIGDPLVVIALLEPRRHQLADDAPGQQVGQGALQSVTHLDAHVVLVRCDDDEHAVVLVRAAEFPGVEWPIFAFPNIACTNGAMFIFSIIPVIR
jgi:hypothetical protein